MTSRQQAAEPRPVPGRPWIPTAGEPHDRCFRCGRPTPLGISLCEQDNPGRVKAPSATQVHGTVAVGVVAGFIGFALLVRLLTAGVGPFGAIVVGSATQADGGVEVVVQVTNDGSRDAAASCRVSRGGVQGANDAVFFTDVIPAGETRNFARTVPPPPADTPVRQPAALAVRCN